MALKIGGDTDIFLIHLDKFYHFPLLALYYFGEEVTTAVLASEGHHLVGAHVGDLFDQPAEGIIEPDGDKFGAAAANLQAKGRGCWVG